METTLSAERAKTPEKTFSAISAASAVSRGQAEETAMPRVKITLWCLFIVPIVCVIAASSSKVETQGRPNAGVTVYEGARLITGDGSPPIESSAFIVANAQCTRVGRRRELQVPAGAARVDLAGKTVMPTKVDLHGHLGFQHVSDGTMTKEY